MASVLRGIVGAGLMLGAVAIASPANAYGYYGGFGGYGYRGYGYGYGGYGYRGFGYYGFVPRAVYIAPPLPYYYPPYYRPSALYSPPLGYGRVEVAPPGRIVSRPVRRARVATPRVDAAPRAEMMPRAEESPFAGPGRSEGLMPASVPASVAPFPATVAPAVVAPPVVAPPMVAPRAAPAGPPARNVFPPESTDAPFRGD